MAGRAVGAPVLALLLIASIVAQRPVGLPPHWCFLLAANGRYPSYEAGVDRAMRHHGRVSAYLRRGSGADFGLSSQIVGQYVRADRYRGKRVCLRGYLRTLNATSAGLMLRIEGEQGELLGFYNGAAPRGHEPQAKQTTDWARYEIVLDVPARAIGITFGFALYGVGEVWSDGMALSVVPGTTPLSVAQNGASGRSLPRQVVAEIRKTYERAPLQPMNLGFDQ